MKLPIPLLQKKEVKNYFLALLLRDDNISAVVFEEESGKIKLVGKGADELKTSLDEISFEELLEACDKAIGTAESSLPNNVETHKTVFGVKESWVEDTKIKREHLVHLKQLSEQLDLKPLGFLIFSEAIAHLLQKEEGAPISAVLIDVGTKHATATLLRAGRVVETKETKLGESIPLTIDELLKTFESSDILPSRILLFNVGGSTRLAQQFISHQWSKSLPFLHVPQITLLETDFEARAILFGTAAQLGFETIDLEKNTDRKTISNAHDIASEDLTRVANEDGSTSHSTLKDEHISLDSKSSLDDSSVASNADIEDLPQDNKAIENNQDSETDDVRAENFGFFKDKDVLKNVESAFAEIPETVKVGETHEGTKSGEFPIQVALIGVGMRKVFSSFKKAIPANIFAAIFKRKPAGVKSGSSPLKNPMVFLLSIFILAIVGCGAWYVMSVKASVVLTVQPNIIDQTKDVSFSTSTPSDFQNNILSGQNTTIDENGQSTTNATGTKEVGDSAKGSVTIYNKLTDPQTLSQGTILTASNGLRFTLDQNVTVASASGANDPFSSTTPGTTQATVTASTFGTEYNLPSGTVFSFSGSSTIAAKNDNAFSGGTKKQVTVVAQSDITKLTNDLVKSLEQKARDDSGKNVPSGKTILPVFVSETLTKKTYDKDIGTQAKTVTLNGTVTYTSIAYDAQEFQDFATKTMQNQFPSNLSLTKNGVTFTITNTSLDKNTVKANVTLHAALIPKIQGSEIAKKITGKSQGDVKKILSDIPGLSSVDVNLTPNIFILPKILPLFPNHISVNLQSNE